MNKEKEKNLAISITDAINGSFDKKVFVEQMAREHRFLQSEFTSLCLEWLKKCRNMYEENCYDGRNEHSVKTGKLLTDYIESPGYGIKIKEE